MMRLESLVQRLGIRLKKLRKLVVSISQLHLQMSCLLPAFDSQARRGDKMEGEDAEAVGNCADVGQLTSSANAMTVIFKDYKAATSDEKAFYYLYLDGVREGIIELNVVLEEK